MVLLKHSKTMTKTKSCVKINTTHRSLQSLLAPCSGDLGQVNALAQDCLKAKAGFFEAPPPLGRGKHPC